MSNVDAFVYLENETLSQSISHATQIIASKCSLCFLGDILRVPKMVPMNSQLAGMRIVDSLQPFFFLLKM